MAMAEEANGGELADNIKLLKQELHLQGNQFEVLGKACDVLGIPKEGSNTTERARRCCQELERRRGLNPEAAGGAAPSVIGAAFGVGCGGPEAAAAASTARGGLAAAAAQGAAAARPKRRGCLTAMRDSLGHDTDLLLIPAALMMALQFLQTPFKLQLNSNLGLLPRTGKGLLGILFSHFLHVSWNHYRANMGAWFILGCQLLSDGFAAVIATCAFMGLFGGLLMWVCGPGNTIGVGLSLVIYGLWSFLMVSVCLECPFSLRRLVVLLLVACLYEPLEFLEGATPKAEEGISWQGHLCGLLAGVVWAVPYYRAFVIRGREVGGIRRWLQHVQADEASPAFSGAAVWPHAGNAFLV